MTAQTTPSCAKVTCFPSGLEWLFCTLAPREKAHRQLPQRSFAAYTNAARLDELVRPNETCNSRIRTISDPGMTLVNRGETVIWWAE